MSSAGSRNNPKSASRKSADQLSITHANTYKLCKNMQMFVYLLRLHLKYCAKTGQQGLTSAISKNLW